MGLSRGMTAGPQRVNSGKLRSNIAAVVSWLKTQG